MKKILVIGAEPSDFFTPIAKTLKKEGFTVDLIEFRKDQKRSNLSEDYSNVELGRREDLNFKSYGIIRLLLCFFSRLFWIELFSQLNLKEAFRITLLYQKYRPIFEKYDLINVHFLDEGAMWIAKALPNTTRNIFSFWGSDLFAAKKTLVAMQNRSLKAAQVVTMQTPEMRNLFRAKFPDHSFKEVSLQRFGVANSFIEGCDLQKENRLGEVFKKKMNFPDDKLLVTISYSANPVSNHNKILDELNSIQSEFKEKIHLILPFSYGGDEEYRTQVKEKLSQLGCSFSVIESFLELEELISLRVVSDLYIHANKTDAFSNSMLEYLHAENICLIADWLPYQLLKDTGANFVEFDTFEELSAKLEYAISNYKTLVETTKKNPQLIRDNFSLKSTVKNWVDLYQKMI